MRKVAERREGTSSRKALFDGQSGVSVIRFLAALKVQDGRVIQIGTKEKDSPDLEELDAVDIRAVMAVMESTWNEEPPIGYTDATVSFHVAWGRRFDGGRQGSDGRPRYGTHLPAGVQRKALEAVEVADIARLPEEMGDILGSSGK